MFSVVVFASPRLDLARTSAKTIGLSAYSDNSHLLSFSEPQHLGYPFLATHVAQML